MGFFNFTSLFVDYAMHYLSAVGFINLVLLWFPIASEYFEFYVLKFVESCFIKFWWHYFLFS